MKQMIECLYIEIEKRKNYLDGKTVETIYFGGGTPSVLESEKIKYLLENNIINTAILNLSRIQSMIDKSKNDLEKTLDLKILKEKNLINNKYLKLKILGTGEIKTNIEITAHFASKQALTKIEKAGGKINLVKK